LLQRGISLIELITFIVIISVALVGILLVMNITIRSSADPLIHKQALAIAESLLEEVESMPFTWCDPDDASAVTATSQAGCTYPEATPPGGPETIGGVTEARYGGAGVNSQFDNVNDYAGFGMADGAILDINSFGGAPTGYTVAPIVITPTALGTIQASESLLITVKVTGPDNVPVTLDGYRTRYAPNSGP
jgi:MSHA pilin protein MshD